MVASRVVWASVAGLALLVPLVWALGRAGDAQLPGVAGRRAEPGVATAEVERLGAELAEERERSQDLAREVEWLRAQLDALARSERVTPSAAGGVTDELAELTEPKSATEAPDGHELWFDGEALAAGGVPTHEVERLREAFDASEMELIDLEHQARREGWYRSGKYWQALRDMRIGLREDIGDDSFDLLLYATGRHNRVVIDDVLRDSPGERAGFQAGDVVLSYGGSRVFKAGELKQATTQGDVGDRVSVDVLRGGERVRVYAQRGPIGVKLRAARLLPEVR